MHSSCWLRMAEPAEQSMKRHSTYRRYTGVWDRMAGGQLGIDLAGRQESGIEPPTRGFSVRCLTAQNPRKP